MGNFYLYVISFIFLALPINISAQIIYELNTEYSGAAPPAGLGPWATATFTDMGGTIKLELSFLGVDNGEKLTSWLFNFGPDTTVSGLSLVTTTYALPGELKSFQTGTDAFKAGPAHDFDIQFDFNTSKNTFDRGETLVFEIAHSTLSLDPSNFDFTNEDKKGPFSTAAHVQAIGSFAEDSGWITQGDGPPGGGGNGEVPVPEPMSLLLMGSLLGSGVWMKRRRKQ